MKLVVTTDEAYESLAEVMEFWSRKLNPLKLEEMMNGILDRIDTLSFAFAHGQIEPYLEKRKSGHRRLIHGHVKIIYRVEKDTVFVTDIFDSRMDPDKMKR